jgi:Flp pilus assembly pilin Flp
MCSPVRFRDDDGAAIVEFAIVVPLLILVLVACFDFARAVSAYVTVANASREGARYATVHPGASPDEVRGFLASRIAPLDPATFRVEQVTFVPTSDTRWIATLPRPNLVSVEVSYRWDAATSLIGSFFTVAAGSATFDVSSTMEAIQ